MKKNYITPEVLTVTVRTATLLGNCDAINSETLQGVTYGGVDEEGTIDPSARRGSVWDDEEEEEDY